MNWRKFARTVVLDRSLRGTGVSWGQPAGWRHGGL